MTFDVVVDADESGLHILFCLSWVHGLHFTVEPLLVLFADETIWNCKNDFMLDVVDLEVVVLFELVQVFLIHWYLEGQRQIT